jgi:hypothetical protein
MLSDFLGGGHLQTTKLASYRLIIVEVHPAPERALSGLYCRFWPEKERHLNGIQWCLLLEIKVLTG